MKNLIIIGPPRSGKTTLAKLLVKEIPCYSAINMDVIREGIYTAFFDGVDKHERKMKVKNIAPKFVGKMLEQYTKYYNPDAYYIIEGDMISIEKALELSFEYNSEIVCIGTPQISKEDLFKRIRCNAAKYGCWTRKYTDSELLENCQGYIDCSKKQAKIAKENNIIYLDTSLNMGCLYEYVERIKNR